MNESIVFSAVVNSMFTLINVTTISLLITYVTIIRSQLTKLGIANL